MSLADRFPVLGLRLATARLVLRLPSTDELAELAELAAAGVHDAGVQPFTVAWTDGPPDVVARRVIQHHWEKLGAWRPAEWALNLSVFHDGTLIGQQSLSARDLLVRREVSTGSWLGQEHQGMGFGTEMRAAVLHLAFAGLGAETAVSAAADHNVASQGVSCKLGYEPDGVNRHTVRGKLRVEKRFRLSRARWRQHPWTSVTMDGLPPCLPLFGAPESGAPAFR